MHAWRQPRKHSITVVVPIGLVVQVVPLAATPRFIVVITMVEVTLRDTATMPNPDGIPATTQQVIFGIEMVMFLPAISLLPIILGGEVLLGGRM